MNVLLKSSLKNVTESLNIIVVFNHILLINCACLFVTPSLQKNFYIKQIPYNFLYNRDNK